MQICVAIGLFRWDALWWKTTARSMDMPGPSPASQLLLSINLPLALPHALLSRHLYGWWDSITFTVAIGLFWYWVAMNIVSWRERRVAHLFSWRPLRILADIVIVGMGVFWIVVCWKEISHYPDERLFSVPTPLWYALLLGLSILWGMVLVSFFGYDCILSLPRRTAA